MVSPLLGHELDSLLLLLLLFSSSTADFINTGPISLLPHRKHGSQPQQVSGTTAKPASSSSLHHCAFPEDRGEARRQRGCGVSKGCPQEQGCYNTWSCCMCLKSPQEKQLRGFCTGKLLLWGQQPGQKGGNVAGIKSTYLRDNLKALLI